MLLPIIVSSVAIASPLPSFTLEDQFERSHRATDLFDGRPVLIVGGDERQSDDQIRDWAKALRGRLGPEVRVFGLANLDGVPFFVPNQSVRNGLKEKNPKTIVLCDWDGRVFERLGFEEDTISVHVYDGKGRLLIKIRGPTSPDRLESIVRVISMPQDRRPKPKSQTATAAGR
jgi:hypothetical protein